LTVAAVRVDGPGAVAGVLAVGPFRQRGGDDNRGKHFKKAKSAPGWPFREKSLTLCRRSSLWAPSSIPVSLTGSYTTHMLAEPILAHGSVNINDPSVHPPETSGRRLLVEPDSQGLASSTSRKPTVCRLFGLLDGREWCLCLLATLSTSISSITSVALPSECAKLEQRLLLATG
jgi:hypothetical protein